MAVLNRQYGTPLNEIDAQFWAELPNLTELAYTFHFGPVTFDDLHLGAPPSTHSIRRLVHIPPIDLINASQNIKPMVEWDLPVSIAGYGLQFVSHLVSTRQESHYGDYDSFYS